MPIEFMAACNDWRNGMPMNRFEHSEFLRPEGFGCIAEFEHMPTTVSHDKEFLRVGRLRVRYLNYRQWVGNWCWNQWLLSEKAAAKVVNYLRAKRQAHCIGGEVIVTDRIEASDYMMARDWKPEQRQS